MLSDNCSSRAAVNDHSPFTIHYLLPDTVGATADDDDDFAAQLLRDATEFGYVGDERAVRVRAASDARRGHRRLVVDINPRAARASEAVAGDAARLRRACDFVVVRLGPVLFGLGFLLVGGATPRSRGARRRARLVALLPRASADITARARSVVRRVVYDRARLVARAVGRLHFDAAREVRTPLLLRSEEHTSELQSRSDLVCRLLLEKK